MTEKEISLQVEEIEKSRLGLAKTHERQKTKENRGNTKAVLDLDAGIGQFTASLLSSLRSGQ